VNATVEGLEMSHSLLNADRRTHGKIVGIALAGAMSLIMLGIAAIRADTDAPTTRPQASAPVLKAGTPIMSATAYGPTVR
jgi:hypothetical protein